MNLYLWHVCFKYQKYERKLIVETFALLICLRETLGRITNFVISIFSVKLFS